MDTALKVNEFSPKLGVTATDVVPLDRRVNVLM
jgi:hypothetical protein